MAFEEAEKSQKQQEEDDQRIFEHLRLSARNTPAPVLSTNTTPGPGTTAQIQAAPLVNPATETSASMPLTARSLTVHSTISARQPDKRQAISAVTHAHSHLALDCSTTMRVWPPFVLAHLIVSCSLFVLCHPTRQETLTPIVQPSMWTGIVREILIKCLAYALSSVPLLLGSLSFLRSGEGKGENERESNGERAHATLECAF